MQTSLSDSNIAELRRSLTGANQQFLKTFPGETDARQPVHTVYGGAHLFRKDTAVRMNELSLRSLTENAPNAVVFAKALHLRGWETLDDKQADRYAEAAVRDIATLRKVHPDAAFACTVYDRVTAKLKREALEDFRIDFEDGYGNRPDPEEDGHAQSAAAEVAAGLAAGTLPPFIGIRIKPFSEELVARSLRTLDIFVTSLVRETKGRLPENFVVTIPKVTIPEQVTAFVRALDQIEQSTGLPAKSLKLELMIETPQSILNDKGESNLPHLVHASEGRCRGAHFGTYDYTALCNITAAYQGMGHQACDFARHMMQVALASRGLMLSDGATNVMPVGPNRAKEGQTLTQWQIEENRQVVHRAWKLAYDHNRHSLENAYYQGWDLHPAQLPVRYAAVYSFFLEGLEAASLRLRMFMDKAAQATLVGDVFDDAATGQGLLNFFLRGMACGAIKEEETVESGLTLDEFRSRSFLKILNMRKK